MPSYDPLDACPLLGLPDELCNDSLSSMQPDEKAWSENRKYLCNVLRQVANSSTSVRRVTSRQVWQILVPFRPQLTALQRQPNASRDSYEWIINSLDNWFSRAPLSRLEYVQWSIAGLIDVMLAKELGARSAQFNMATKVLEDVLQNSSAHDLNVLRASLLLASASPTSSPW